MASTFDVCIRGDGIVGRAMALLLAQQRLRVGLVQGPGADGAQFSDVRAYAINAASRSLLQDLRAWPEGDATTPVTGMRVHGDAGGQVHFESAPQGQPALAWIADSGQLMSALGDAIRYQPQVQLLSEAAPAELTVVCEGKASATRAAQGVAYDITRYPQQAIAARLSCELPHGQVARQWFEDGQILALLPTGGEQGRSCALVWSVRQERAAGLAALPAPDFETLITQASHGALGRLTLASERACWPLQRATATRWCGPGWVLAGDAAHTVHPLAGQGLNLGLADVRELAQVLHAREYWRSIGDERLLRRYERARKGDVAAMQCLTGGLQMLFGQPARPWGLIRNWGMNAFERLGPVKQWAARQAAGHL